MVKEVFVDTCVLETLFHYLDLAITLNLPPYKKSRISVAELKNNFINLKTVDSISEAILDTTVQGFKTFCYFKNLSEGSRIYYSQLSITEMIHTALEQHIYWYLLKKGISYKARKSFLKNAEGYPHTKVIMSKTRPSYAVRRIKGYMMHLEDLMDHIQIIPVERALGIRTEQIPELHNTLTEEILIEVVDSLLFTQAMLIQADEFLTFDNGLRKTISYLNQGSRGMPDINWMQSRKSIMQKLSQLLGYSLNDVVLPEALSPAQGDPVLDWDIPCQKRWWKYA